MTTPSRLNLRERVRKVSDHPRVLIVEDNHDLVEFLTYILRHKRPGLDLSVAFTSQEIDYATSYDIALIDVMLAESEMDGLEVSHLVRVSNPDCRIVIWSAGNPLTEIGDADIGIQKPASTDEILEAMLL